MSEVPLPGPGDRFNLIDVVLLRHLSEAARDRPALIFGLSAISYAQLARATALTRELLKGYGIGRSDRVALLLPDCPAYVYLLLAAISLGAIVVPINPKHSPQEARRMLEHVGTKLVFLDAAAEDSRFIDVFGKPGLHLLAVDRMMECALSGVTEPTDDSFVPEATVGADILYLLFSSGTTGQPKAIIRRHSDIAWTASAFAVDVLRMSAADRVLAVPKLTFGYALVGNLLFALLHGATSILIPEVSTAETMLEAIRRHEPSIFLAQPRMLAELSEFVTMPATTACIRATVSAGDVLSPAVRQRWLEKTGLNVIDGFGSTEAGHIFACNDTPDHPAEAVGRGLRGYELKIVDAQADEVADGTAGRLCIRGASVSTGYWNDPMRTSRSFDDGWFISDDLFVRKEGFYFYSGRWDDMIKTGCGEWIAPHLLENMLLRDQGVRDCAVVGAHDERDVVRVKAYIVRATTAESDRALIGRLRGLPERQWPALEHMRLHMVELVDAIPRSTNGKIQRHRLSPKTLTEFSYEC